MQKLSIHKNLRLFYLMLSCCLYACTGQTQHNKGKDDKDRQEIHNEDSLIYQSYGMIDDVYTAQAKQKVFARYGFKEVYVAACVVDDATIAAAEAHNDSLMIRLSKQFNRPVTRAQLYDEVKEEIAIVHELEAIINTQGFAKRRLKEIKTDDYYFYVSDWQQDSMAGTYLVTVREMNSKGSEPDGLLWQLKVIPSANKVLLKNKEGQWNEGTR